MAIDNKQVPPTVYLDDLFEYLEKEGIDTSIINVVDDQEGFNNVLRDPR